MKTTILLGILLISFNASITAQITTPIIKARFGVDADVRANYFNGLVQTGNDDWYNFAAADTAGKAVIDTTGATAIVAAYNADVSPWPRRMASFYRTMSRPAFSIVNNRLWLDAIFVRDYHGNDTTVFVSGSDKNGMSPANWTGGIQGIPDKNDILDMFMHVRRAGPNTTDSLWLFGGLSLDNTTGNRYFDFEMYQTDIYYDRVSGKFYGYGPDAGHTSWKFNAAGGISVPGDIIFNGEFQSGTLTSIQARVWVSKADWLTVTPTAFNWGGQFDGDGASATYGYASITPNTTGTFYTGLGSANNAWAGPFGLVLQDNSLAFTNPAPATTTNSKYIANQLIEFSVNLTKLGLDPVTLIGGDVCGTPFNRIVVKTRASASFTAELKDFVAPTDLFLAPRAVVATATPYICDTGSIASIYVTNPIATSVYQWTTTNGRILGPTNGTSIIIDTPGVYIVRQFLQAGCSLYATDTIQVFSFGLCDVLNKNLVDFKGILNTRSVRLDWKVLFNSIITYFEIERSEDGINFVSIGQVPRSPSPGETATYSYVDDIEGWVRPYVFYRIRIQESGKIPKYSQVIKLSLQRSTRNEVFLYPNPARDFVHVQAYSIAQGEMRVKLFNANGKLVNTQNLQVQKGYNSFSMDAFVQQPKGVYYVTIMLGDEIFSKKMIIVH